MPTLTINGKEITVEDGMTVLQACEQAGVEIPRFCYHERLSIAGSCRMCLVEMERSPKLIASCAMPAGDGMVITTNNERVQQARKDVMELLLLNHPLDCPVCDQGGECDLQDQSLHFGGDRGHNIDGRRKVQDKYMGPFVSTVMTRCIQCTRCVRFISEIAGTYELAGVSRGEHLEITPFVETALTSELSGNLVDVCPVGALTNTQYAFRARPWELIHTDSIDVMDGLGSNIRLDSRGGEVLRIVPRLNEEVNEEWLSDKGRYIVDALKQQRLDRVWMRKNGKLEPASWDEAFAIIVDKVGAIAKDKQAAIAGDLIDAETAYSFRMLLDNLGIDHRDCAQDGSYFDYNKPSSWRFNTTIEGIEQADAILLIGTNPRHEAPVLNARIRKRYLQGGLKIAYVGEECNLTYKAKYLGNDLSGCQNLIDALDGENPMIILGEAALRRNDAAAVMKQAEELLIKVGGLRDDWNGFNIFHSSAGRMGALQAGFFPKNDGLRAPEIAQKARQGAIELVWLLGADEIADEKLGDNSFVIYVGHHGDKGAACADIILPVAAFHEKSSTYVNMEGRAQRSNAALAPLGDAKEDWAVIRMLSEKLECTLPWDSLQELRAHMAEYSEVFATIDHIVPRSWESLSDGGKIEAGGFHKTIENYYMTNMIARNSPIMARATKEITNQSQEEGA